MVRQNIFNLVFFLLVTFYWAHSVDEDTFRNVEFKGYSVYTLKFTKTIDRSNSLKEHIPEGHYDHLEFVDQSIPKLHENSISQIDYLDELTIQNCELKEIQPGAFKKLPSLRRLNLHGNDLEEIKTGVFNNLPLSTLDLSKNKIKNIESTALDNLPNILNINLADNLLAVWDKKWFHNTPLLTRISMQNNSLEKIPSEAFTNLAGNKKFGSVELSINLIFSYNKISQIGDNAFKGLEKINNLWLDNNKLTEFKDTVLKEVEVQDLRIEHNQLTCLTGNLDDILKADTTHMDGNPLDCDCVKKIKKWRVDHNQNVDLFYSDMNCEADRLSRKMDSLEKRLKEISAQRNNEGVPRDREETTKYPEVASSNEIEIIFK